MKYLFLTILVFCAFTVFPQEINYNKIILPKSYGSDIEFNEKLVQLAWNNHPNNSITNRTVKIAKHNHTLTVSQWFDIFQFQANFNEFTINPSSDVFDRSAYYPRYNLGINFTLGTFISLPTQNRIAREAISISEDEVNSKKLQVREQILKSYNLFIMFKEIYHLQSLAVSDAESSHQLVENAFNNGEVTFERYINSLTALNNLRIENIQAETNFLNAKLELEAQIGIPLEEVQ